MSVIAVLENVADTTRLADDPLAEPDPRPGFTPDPDPLRQPDPHPGDVPDTDDPLRRGDPAPDAGSDEPAPPVI